MYAEGRYLVSGGKCAGQNTVLLALEKAGHTIKLCHTGSIAIKTLKEFEPHLIIFNAASMRTNGSRTCRRLKKNREDLPIIHVRAAGEFQDDEAEADIYLEQPFTLVNCSIVSKICCPSTMPSKKLCSMGIFHCTFPKICRCRAGESRLTPKLAHLLEQFMRHLTRCSPGGS